MTRALVGTIQRYSTEDGPGIRTTVFLKGCPLTCRWCHNPELISPTQDVIFSNSKCITCGYCAQSCPENAIMMGLAPVIDRAKCTVCLKCAEVCYAKAMTPVAIPMSAYDVAGTVVRDKSFYGNTGGGLTISGGEVLMHADFAEELIGLCYKEHITSCLDTSGYGPGAALDRLASLPGVTDILYDIKALDDDVHTKYTGVSNTLILENLDMLTKKHGGRVKIHARLPLIKEVNDDFALLARTAKALAAFGVADATLIPYHNLGVGKARNIGETMTSFEPPDDEALRRIKNEFLHNGVACSVLAALES